MGRSPREIPLNVQVVKGDWWPARDTVCKNVAYDFRGADRAIRLCKKLDLAIQAGGCVGAWPRYLRTKFSKVVTFEVSRENFALMTHNLQGLDIALRHAALGDRSGFCRVHEDPKNCGNDQTRAGDDVPVVAIDELELSPDLIYLDIQGDEVKALKGAKETIARCRPVIAVEYEPSMMKDGCPRKYLKSIGYVCKDHAHQDYIFTGD